jgi:Holliday junction resolvasome RuvABC endonuclease subunit
MRNISNRENEEPELERHNRMSETFPILLAIDPSVNNLGFACVDFREDIADLGNWKYGLIHPEGKYIQHKWKDAYTKLRNRLEETKITHYAAEWPSYFDSQKGRIAAQEGYTVNLAGMVAYIAGRLRVKGDYIALWTPQQWKGSVPKEVTVRKFIRLFGRKAERVSKIVSSDVIDAIMIGAFWIDLYNREKFSWQFRKDNIYVR